MTLARSNWLILLSPLLLACGDSDAKDDSLSATGGGSNVTITSASETNVTTPTGTGESASEGTSAPGSTSNDSASGGSSSDGSGPTTGVTGTSGDTSGDMTGMTSMTSGESGSSTGAPIDVPVPCQVETTKITPIPPDLLFVLDKSGSMSYEVWDHDKNPQTPTVTRWFSLHGVVESVVKTFDKTVNFGVKLYPKITATPFIDQGACDVDPGVEVEIAPMNAAAVLAGIPAADFGVLGGTPIESGLKQAYTYLKALDPGQQRFALLIADGEITKACDGETILETIGMVASSHQAGIPTYVVGIDVDPSIVDDLTALAEAGGKPNPDGPELFYQVTNQIELQAAIQGILDDTLSCVIDVDPEPSAPELFEVWIGKDQVPAAADCAKDDGWVWTKPNSQIELCGAACLQLKKSGQVEARYFCEPK
ncbi:MAG: VWA domain-containing protein [Nannocystis sp.]|nr:VWA domain-containing protein [Nannocystis sp.]MBA3547432.1 VWA domain-containing protein [Nannocystis sp.]